MTRREMPVLGLSFLTLLACGSEGGGGRTSGADAGPGLGSGSGSGSDMGTGSGSGANAGADAGAGAGVDSGAGTGVALPYRIGAAKVDITGPFAGSSTGYNDPGTQMTGLSMRLYSRAFVIEDPNVAGSILSIATADMLHSHQSVKLGVIKKLASDGYTALRDENVMFTGTHTHSAPSNISWYSTYDGVNGVSGFDPLNYAVVVNGIAGSIEKAYDARKPGTIKIAQGILHGASNNRAAPAYRADTDATAYATDVDETMTLLRFDGADGSAIGAINWFGVHGTSLGITNHREHGDNKGWAAYAFEQSQGNDFVAAFAQGLFGDVSPNTPDPTGAAKPFVRPSDTSPSIDPLENPIIHGTLQLSQATALYKTAATLLPVALDTRYAYRDYNDIAVGDAAIGAHQMPWDTGPVQYPIGVPIPAAGAQAKNTCVGVVGGGILSGDPEGAPVSVSPEGTIHNTYTMQNGTWVFTKYNLTQLGPFLWVLGSGANLLLSTDQYTVCHKEKYALIGVGNGNPPSVATILPLQLLKIGSLVIAAAPFELTTMTGRRIRSQLESVLEPAGVNTVVVAGMSNAYAMYMATREEYGAQYFEGSSTLFGPWASAATLQGFDTLAHDLVAGRASAAGPVPPDRSNQTSLTPIASSGVPIDAPGAGLAGFGAVITDVAATYNRAHDTVVVTFQGAHPRSIQELQVKAALGPYYDAATYSYFEIQKQGAGGSYTTIARDGNPYTAFDWTDTTTLGQATSKASVTWLLRNADAGTYSVVYHGLAKTGASTYRAFTGTSSAFAVQ